MGIKFVSHAQYSASSLPVASGSVTTTIPLIGSSITHEVPSIQDLPQISKKISIPETIPSAKAPSYAERFKSSLRNLRKISSPTFQEDGTPVVQAPASVLLQTATMWKGHIIAQFHGLIPPPAKIYNDLNPAWGKFGNITIRTVSETSCLILIPCLSTREWVLQIGYWQAGNCAFSVYPWSPEGTLEKPELETAPTWAILKNVPPQMYSLDGISVITSALGEPLHTEKSRLDPYHFGDTKVKVEICLDSSPPTTIVVRDTHGNTARVNVTYPRLPPKCCNCGRFGHLLNKCPKPLMKKAFGSGGDKPFVAGGVASTDTKISLAPEVMTKISPEMVAAVKALPQIPSNCEASPVKTRLPKRRSRSKSRHNGRGSSAPPIKIHDKVVVVKTDSRSEVLQVKVSGDGSIGSSEKQDSANGVKGRIISLKPPIIGHGKPQSKHDEDGFVTVKSKRKPTLANVGSQSMKTLIKLAASKRARQLHLSVPGSSLGPRRDKSGFCNGSVSSNATQGRVLGGDTHL